MGVPLVFRDGLEPQHLTSEQDVVAIVKLVHRPEAEIDAVSVIERGDHRSPEGQAQARMTGRKLRIVDPNIALGATDIDLIVLQPIDFVVLAVG